MKNSLIIKLKSPNFFLLIGWAIMPISNVPQRLDRVICEGNNMQAVM